MSGTREPIASTTIARLYLAQGHRRKAARMLDTLIERDPSDGAALHLRERLHATESPIVTASVDDDALEVSWEFVRSDPPRHVVVTSFLSVGTLPRVIVTSAPCEESSGSCTFSRPSDPGSAVVCVGFVGPTGFVAEATAGALVWSSGEEPET